MDLIQEAIAQAAIAQEVSGVQEAFASSYQGLNWPISILMVVAIVLALWRFKIFK